MNADILFDLLDLNKDGRLSRSELYEAAIQLKWHWREAPLFAFLDLFSIREPIPKRLFDAHLQIIFQDPMGVYGDALLTSPHFSAAAQNLRRLRSIGLQAKEKGQPPKKKVPTQGGQSSGNTGTIMEHYSRSRAANGLREKEGPFDPVRINRGKAALLLIDLQRSFTQGVWKQSIGPGADQDVLPIRQAFDNCRLLLENLYGEMDIMFTRCPFPPESYGWDDGIADILADGQLYFIKPGNNALFPPTNGLKEWVTHCLLMGKNILVVGGCTLNSCIRVSAIKIQEQFRKTPLQVIVGLELSGARMSNFQPAPQFDGISAAQSAVHQMRAAGVKVVRKLFWE